MRSTLLLLAALAIVACRPEPPPRPPAPQFTGDPEKDCATACEQLRLLACPEGYGSISGETCERRCVIALELRPLPLACWAESKDVVSARACGSLRCTRK